MTTVFWVILAAVTVVFGFFSGFVFGFNVSEENAVRTGKMTRKGVKYRVSLDTGPEDVADTEVNRLVVQAMRAGKYDAEIERIVARNNKRRGQ